MEYCVRGSLMDPWAVARACFGIDIHVVEKDRKNVRHVKVW